MIAVGIDIGGTNTKIAIVRESGETLSYVSFPTDSHEPFDLFLEKIHSTVLKLVAKDNLKLEDIKGMGVGCPNADTISGKLVSPPNLGWGSVDLRGELDKLFPFPIFLSNDANVAAYGEKKWGQGRGYSDFIVVTLGTGIGTGIFVQNEILIGTNGLAGEGGHIIIEPEGRPCHCGGKGHLECYASVRGIKETVKEITGEDLKFREIAARYIAKEEKFLEAFDRTAKYLAYGLADMGTLFAPKAFILAGGIATIGESFRDDVQKYYKDLIFPPFKDDTQILISDIATEHGAVLGAASQVFF